MTTPHLKLAIFDIDGTLRRVRDPWVHLHQHLGVLDQADGFVEQWERGQITYEEWVRLDAELWRGQSRQSILAALKTSPYRDGARELVAWFTARSIPCVGISTGLSIFNEVTLAELGLTEVLSNELYFDKGVFNGQISINVREDNKSDLMNEVLVRYGVEAAQVVAFGDGSADIPLLANAGLGIAVFPSKDKIRLAANLVIDDEPIDKAIPFVADYFIVEQ